MNAPGATDNKKTHQPIGTYVVTGIGLLADIIALLTFFGAIRVTEGGDIDLQALSPAFITAVAIAIVYSLGLLISALARRWEARYVSQIPQDVSDLSLEDEYKIEQTTTLINRWASYLRLILAELFCIPLVLILLALLSSPEGWGWLGLVFLGLTVGFVTGFFLSLISFLFDLILDLAATF